MNKFLTLIHGEPFIYDTQKKTTLSLIYQLMTVSIKL